MYLEIATKTEVFHEFLINLLLVSLGHLDDFLGLLALLLVNAPLVLSAGAVVSFLETHIKLFNVSAAREYGEEEEQAEHPADVLQGLPERGGGGHDLELSRPKVHLHPALLPLVVPQDSRGQRGDFDV